MVWHEHAWVREGSGQMKECFLNDGALPVSIVALIFAVKDNDFRYEMLRNRMWCALILWWENSNLWFCPARVHRCMMSSFLDEPLPYIWICSAAFVALVMLTLAVFAVHHCCIRDSSDQNDRWDVYFDLSLILYLSPMYVGALWYPSRTRSRRETTLTAISLTPSTRCSEGHGRCPDFLFTRIWFTLFLFSWLRNTLSCRYMSWRVRAMLA